MLIPVTIRGQLLTAQQITLAEKSLNKLFCKVDADEEWDGLAMSFIFRSINATGVVEREVVPADINAVRVPPECIRAGHLFITAIGVEEGGTVRLTTADMPYGLYISPVAALAAGAPDSITPTQFEQLLSLIGPVSKLDTNAKNLADAINEVLQHFKAGHSVAQASSDDGKAYIAKGSDLPVLQEVVGIAAQVIFIPTVKNTVQEPTLALNGGKAYPIKIRNPEANSVVPSVHLPVPVGALMAGLPYLLTFSLGCWFIDSWVGSITEHAFSEGLANYPDADLCGIPIFDNLFTEESGKFSFLNILRTPDEEGEHPGGVVEVPSFGTTQKLIESYGSSSVYVSLPDYIHVAVNSELRVYFRNILSRDDARLWIGYNDKLVTKYCDEYFTITAETEGRYALPWEVFDAMHHQIASGNLEIIATENISAEEVSVIVIGDSTVNAGVMTKKLAELYEANGTKLTLLGTRGNGTHEGRSGWTAEDYCTKAAKSDIENPFYNGGFDFTYYMQTQGFAGVHATVIQLGINDIFKFREHYAWSLYDSTDVLAYMEQIVSSIHKYNDNIKVIINLPITPNSDGMAFTDAYGTTQLYWVYNRNIIRFAAELLSRFADRANVIISASNCILDTKTQIKDGVHPTEDGYNTLGQRLYEVLISNIDGSVPVPSLLDIMGRERVVTKISILTGDQRELDTAKCYDTSFGGTRSNNVSTNITSYTPLSKDSFSCQVSKNTGNGLEFPVQLEAGKTYTLSWTSDNANVRAYLMKYNADTTYSANQMLGSGEGTKTATFTAEDGYIYSICFPVLVNNTLCTVSDIALAEKT